VTLPIYLWVLLANRIIAQELKPNWISIQRNNYDFFDSTLIASHKAVGGNIFVGTGFWNGTISSYFSNPFFLGLNYDIHRNKLIIQIDDYIGFGKVKQTMLFPENLEWKKNETVIYAMAGCNLGYPIIDTKHFKFVPIGGIGFNLLSALAKSPKDGNGKNEPFLPHYKLGFFMDFKSVEMLDKRVRINNQDQYYTSLRLSFGMTNPIGTPKYAVYYNGSMLYITAGIGGLTREFKKR
jgi:hypothetical protein